MRMQREFYVLVDLQGGNKMHGVRERSESRNLRISETVQASQDWECIQEGDEVTFLA